MLITARFTTLTKAVTEAKKYGVSPCYHTLARRLQRGETPSFSITLDRKLTFTHVPDAAVRPFRLTIDVVGRVVPVNIPNERISL